MQLRDFYQAVLPDQGQYILFQNKGHTFHASIDALVTATEKRIDTQGLYFATASYGPAKNRTQANVLLLKALRIDIDAGAEKFAKHPQDAYPTQRDALTATIAFIKTTGLRPTMVVSSGEGLHVYWCLDQPVDPLAWHGASVLLNAVGRMHGLKIDAGCTADSARVLRPVGTLHKNGNRVTVLPMTGKVWDFRELDEKLRSFDLPAEEAFGLSAKPKAPRERSINDDVLHVEGPPASLARVADHCSAVAAMRDSGGNVPEPHWRAVMGVAKYCEDGEQLIHEWSAGHPDYSARETQEKFDRWETPPTTCQHFSMMHSGCNTCPYRSKVTTPKQVGYVAVPVTAAAPAAIPDAPTPPPPAAAATSPTFAEATGSPKPEPSEEPSSSEDDGLGMALADEEIEDATADMPVPERPDLFDEANPFFYKVVDNRWTLYHKYKEKTKDATGQEIWLEHVKPVAYKLFWVDSNSLPGASDSGGVLLTFGRVERPGSTRQDRIDMPGGITADLKAMCKWLADQGINLAPRSLNARAAEHVMEYVTREKIRKQNDMRFVIKERFGYHFHEGQFICSLGPFTVYPDGSVVRTIINSKLQSLGKVLCTSALPNKPGGRWEPAVWRDLGPKVTRYIKFLRDNYGHPGYEKARLAIAVNLASPYLVFAADSAYIEGSEDLPTCGFMLSLFSEASGVGKSSMMAAIAAAYGKDTFARKGNDASMTAVAASTLAQNGAVYPFLLDEVTQNDAKKAAALIDTMANGVGRMRGTSDGSVRDSGKTWSMVTTVATNVPQRELLTAAQKQSNALLMRLMELNLDDMPRLSDIEGFRNDLKEVQADCGVFGLFQSLVAVKLGRQAMIEKASANVTKAFKILEATQDFRFYARMLGAILTMHDVLGRWSPFDIDELCATFKQAVRETTWYIQANRKTPEAELGALIQHLSPGIGVTKTWSKRTGKDAASDVLLNPHVRMPMVGREVQDWGVVMLDCGAVRDWCMQQQMSVHGFIQRMDKAGYLVKDNGKPRQKMRLSTGLVGVVNHVSDYYRFKTRPDGGAPSLDAVEQPAVETAGA